jgi:hypothetical protein
VVQIDSKLPLLVEEISELAVEFHIIALGVVKKELPIAR